MAGWPLSAAAMVAEAMPFVLIVRSSRVITTFSVHVPLTWITRGVTSTFKSKAPLIVSPGRLQLTLTFAATAATGMAQTANTTMAAGKRARADTNDTARDICWFIRGVPPDGGWWWPTWAEVPTVVAGTDHHGASCRCPTGKKRARHRTPETAAYPRSCQWPTVQVFARSRRAVHCSGKSVQVGEATGEHGEDANRKRIMHLWPGSSARPHRCSVPSSSSI